MIIIEGILVLFIYIRRLALNEIFSPSNKIYREVGRAKDLSAPLYIYNAIPAAESQLQFDYKINVLNILICDKRLPDTTAWRVLRLLEERPSLWRVAPDILNKQSRRADMEWHSSLGGWARC